jgi:hypothetical protein
MCDADACGEGRVRYAADKAIPQFYPLGDFFRRKMTQLCPSTMVPQGAIEVEIRKIKNVTPKKIACIYFDKGRFSLRTFLNVSLAKSFDSKHYENIAIWLVLP